MAGRQDDACPYIRPFSEDFAACPAYRRSEFLAVDMQYRPLRPVNTCAHLEARSRGGRPAGYYGACLIGDAAARRAWAARIESGRLERIRRLAKTLGESTRELSRAMWQAKAEQLRAVREGRPAERQTRRVVQAAERYEKEARRVLERHARELAEIEVEPGAVLELIHEAAFEWAARTTAIESYRPSAEVLDRFPPPVRAFLSPNGS